MIPISAPSHGAPFFPTKMPIRLYVMSKSRFPTPEQSGRAPGLSPIDHAKKSSNGGQTHDASNRATLGLIIVFLELVPVPDITSRPVLSDRYFDSLGSEAFAQGSAFDHSGELLRTVDLEDVRERGSQHRRRTIVECCARVR